MTVTRIDVSGIGSSGLSAMLGGLGSPSLPQCQRQLIEETLARCDAKSLTQSDASAIVEAFSEAGVLPGKALAEAMSDFGFDARAVGETSGAGPTRAGTLDAIKDIFRRTMPEGGPVDIKA